MNDLLVIDVTAAITAFLIWVLIVSGTLLGIVASWVTIIRLVKRRVNNVS